MYDDENEVLQTWFRLRDAMLRTGPEAASAMRPPSLRDACYAYALAHRSRVDTTPELIESFVNGLELGAMAAIRERLKGERR
ncbi:MAG TPA: hypothetical protein VHT52_04180 [Stellaceae bacterium]|jgi:hypothetical protein|nr:hypothetical protein [Stellaceae bacterium]